MPNHVESVKWGHWPRSGPSIVLLLIVAVCLAACQPLLIEDPNPSRPALEVATDQGSQATVSTEDGRVIVDIYSDTGIGTAAVDQLDGIVDSTLLRLHLSGLEEFRFSYGDTVVVASVLTTGENPIHQAVEFEDGGLQPIEPSSDFWLSIKPLDANGMASTVPIPNGYFEIALPADFVQSDLEGFAISWIDFFR